MKFLSRIGLISIFLFGVTAGLAQSQRTLVDVDSARDVTFEISPIMDDESDSFNSCYNIGSSVQITVKVRNNKSTNIGFVLTSYTDQYRLHLTKNGVLLPYKETIARTLEAQERSPRGRYIVWDIEPDEMVLAERLRLRDWYATLSEGVYSIKISYRPYNVSTFFDIGETAFTIGECAIV